MVWLKRNRSNSDNNGSAALNKSGCFILGKTSTFFIICPLYLSVNLKLMVRFFLFIIHFFAFQSVFAQLIIEGQVVNSQKGEPVPYATITAAYNQGTVCDSSGYFILQLKDVSLLDTLTVSSIGFNTSKICIDNYISSKIKKIQLTPRNYYIEDVRVFSDRKKTKKGRFYGITKKKSNSSFGIFALGLIVAQYIENPHSSNGKVKSIRVYSTGREYDPNFKFRLHLYSVDSLFLRPATELLPENVIVSIPNSKKGWVSIDVSKHAIDFHKNGLFVGIEYLIASLRDGKYFETNDEFNTHGSSSRFKMLRTNHMLGYYSFFDDRNSTYLSKDGKTWTSWANEKGNPNIMLAIEVVK